MSTKNKESEPGFGVICPKCNRNSCVINVKGEPIIKNSGVDVKLSLDIVCKDCKYTRNYIDYKEKQK